MVDIARVLQLGDDEDGMTRATTFPLLAVRSWVRDTSRVGGLFAPLHTFWKGYLPIRSPGHRNRSGRTYLSWGIGVGFGLGGDLRPRL